MLRILRQSGDGFRYFLIDAICINQAGSIERARHVRIMLLIYQGAWRVIAWLGNSHENTKDILQATRDVYASGEESIKVLYGLQDLYSRSWIKRIRVQQEIYAARELKFRCGREEFAYIPLPTLRLLPREVHKVETRNWFERKSRIEEGVAPLRRTMRNPNCNSSSKNAFSASNILRDPILCAQGYMNHKPHEVIT